MDQADLEIIERRLASGALYHDDDVTSLIKNEDKNRNTTTGPGFFTWMDLAYSVFQVDEELEHENSLDSTQHSEMSNTTPTPEAPISTPHRKARIKKEKQSATIIKKARQTIDLIETSAISPPTITQGDVAPQPSVPVEVAPEAPQKSNLTLAEEITEMWKNVKLPKQNWTEHLVAGFTENGINSLKELSGWSRDDILEILKDEFEISNTLDRNKICNAIISFNAQQNL